MERLKEIARRRGLTLPQLALAWVLHHSPVTVALVGARLPEEITEAAAAAGVRLSEELLVEIDAVMRDAAGLSEVLPA